MRRKILLVDDSPTVLQLEQSFLSSTDYDLKTAASGGEALQAARTFGPDLVLLDITMPGLDGIAVLRELRARAETRNTPVVMVTTKSDEAHMTSALAAGCTGYITKPFSRTDLLEVVRDALAGADPGVAS